MAWYHYFNYFNKIVYDRNIEVNTTIPENAMNLNSVILQSVTLLLRI